MFDSLSIGFLVGVAYLLLAVVLLSVTYGVWTMLKTLRKLSGGLASMNLDLEALVVQGELIDKQLATLLELVRNRFGDATLSHQEVSRTLLILEEAVERSSRKPDLTKALQDQDHKLDHIIGLTTSLGDNIDSARHLAGIAKTQFATALTIVAEAVGVDTTGKPEVPECHVPV